jgi:hypothetical protein
MAEPGPSAPGKIARSAASVSLPADVWTRIVFAAKESDDYRLRSLVEQAVHEAKAVNVPLLG